MAKRTGYLQGVTIWILLVSILSIIFQSGTASAAVRPARNPAEQAARNACVSGTQGAIWFSSNNDFSDGGYNGGFYEMNVNVPANPGAVTVYIHGSANTCSQSKNYPNRTFYAINIGQGQDGGVNNWRLYNFSSTVMSRGTFAGNYVQYDWTTIPSNTNGYVSASLNVDGLVAPGEVKDITVGLYRCPSYDGTSILGSCGTQQVVVHVTRAQLPWTVTPGIAMKVNGAATTNVYPGQTITWDHSITSNAHNPPQVKYGYRWTSASPPSVDAPANWTVDIGANTTDTSSTATYTVPATLNPGTTPPGTQYCRKTVVNPSSASVAETASAESCATLKYIMWTVSSSTSVNAAEVSPDTPITWTHTLTNSGPDNMTRDLVQVNVDTYMGASPTPVLQTAKDITSQITAKRGNSGVAFATYSGPDAQYTPTQSDIGKYRCQRMAWNEKGSHDSSWGHSAWSCTKIVSHWVVAGVSTTSNNVVILGAPLTWTHTLTDTIDNMVVNVGGAIVRKELSQIAIDTYIGASPTPLAATSTKDITSQLSVKTGDKGVTFVTYTGADATYNPVLTDIGKYICQRITWKDAAWNNTGTGYANWSCALIAQAPYVSVVGGATWSGNATPGSGKITGAATSQAGFGSFADYDVFSTGTVANFGSSGELGKNTGPMLEGTELTFANKPSLGSFTATHTITDLGSRYSDSAVLSNPAVLNGTGNVVASGVYKNTSGGANVVLNNNSAASTIPVGVHAVIYVPNGVVTIAGDISYATNVTPGQKMFGQLPSLTIIARSIVIKSATGRVDATLYATNRLITCDLGPVMPGSSASITKTGACSKQLTINGAVIVTGTLSNSLVLNRSYGGESDGNPAEIVRMRPEVFLTPYEQTAAAGSLLIETVYETELPPRY